MRRRRSKLKTSAPSMRSWLCRGRWPQKILASADGCRSRSDQIIFSSSLPTWRNSLLGGANRLHRAKTDLSFIAMPRTRFALWRRAAWQRAHRRVWCPSGLGARDTLRLEKAYPLYGHELDDTTTPLEAGLAVGDEIFQASLHRARGFVAAKAGTGSSASWSAWNCWSPVSPAADMDCSKTAHRSAGSPAALSLRSLGKSIALGYVASEEVRDRQYSSTSKSVAEFHPNWFRYRSTAVERRSHKA